MLIKQANRLNVGIGDEVEFDFTSIVPRGRRIHVRARVTGYKKRFGLVNGGRHIAGDLLEYTDLETGEVGCWANADLVGCVIRRNPRLSASNVFRADLERAQSRIQFGPVRGTMRGSLFDLIVFELAQLPFRLERPLNQNRSAELFRQQHLANLSSLDPMGPALEFGGRITVRRKLFAAWVRRNACQLMFTVTELRHRETDKNLNDEAEMAMDVELELEFEDEMETSPRDSSDYYPGDFSAYEF